MPFAWNPVVAHNRKLPQRFLENIQIVSGVINMYRNANPLTTDRRLDAPRSQLLGGAGDIEHDDCRAVVDNVQSIAQVRRQSSVVSMDRSNPHLVNQGERRSQGAC